MQTNNNQDLNDKLFEIKKRFIIRLKDQVQQVKDLFSEIQNGKLDLSNQQKFKKEYHYFSGMGNMLGFKELAPFAKATENAFDEMLDSKFSEQTRNKFFTIHNDFENIATQLIQNFL